MSGRLGHAQASELTCIPRIVSTQSSTSAALQLWSLLGAGLPLYAAWAAFFSFRQALAGV